MSLVAQVADGYFTLSELDERIRITHDNIRTREESLRLFKRRFEVGTTTRLDVAQVETLLTQAQSLGAQLEQARAAQAHALTLLVGAQPAGLSDRAANLNDSDLLHELRVGLPSELLQERPDILAAEHRLRAANANIGAARAAFFPSITLTGFFGTASSELDGLFDSGTKAWLFAPQLVLPIFDAGRRQANLDLAKVRRDIAVADYERTIQTAFRDVSDALSSQRWLAEQVAIQRRALAAQQERCAACDDALRPRERDVPGSARCPARPAHRRAAAGAAAAGTALEPRRPVCRARRRQPALRRAASAVVSIRGAGETMTLHEPMNWVLAPPLADRVTAGT